MRTSKSLSKRVAKVGSAAEKVQFLENLIFELREHNPLNARTLSAINTSVEFMARLQNQLHGKPEKKTREELEDELEARRVAAVIIRDLNETERLAVAKVMNRMAAAMKK